MSRFHRLAHFKYRPYVSVGDWVTPDTIIGRVGTTGVSTGPHVHHDGTIGEPRSWYQYKSRPLSEYFDTAPWSHLVLPYDGRYLTSWHGVGGHRGCDINIKPDDEGKLVYSPVNGRVVFVERPYSVYRLVNGVRTLFQPTWGGGFGNFLWVEEDSSQPTV